MRGVFGGTHRAERSPETPAGPPPHLPFAPRSAASADGFGSLWEFGPERRCPPSSPGRWWPRDATPRSLESRGEGWTPTRAWSPDPCDLQDGWESESVGETKSHLALAQTNNYYVSSKFKIATVVASNQMRRLKKEKCNNVQNVHF